MSETQLESGLTAETTIAETDFVRIVTAAGESRTILKSNFGGGTSVKELYFPAGSFDFPASNFAPWAEETGSNGISRYHSMDDTTQESVEAEFNLPDNYDDSVNIEFTIYGYGAATSGNLSFDIDYSTTAADADWDTALTNINTGVTAISATVDGQDEITQSISGAAFAADDRVRFTFGRDTGIDTVTGDWKLTMIRIKFTVS